MGPSGIKLSFHEVSSSICPCLMLRRTRHQEHWRAVETHFRPTRIYGPTCHAIGGTAQLALLSSSAAAIIAGPRHSQCGLRAGRSSRRMDLAAATAGICVTRKSLQRAGRSSLAGVGRSDPALRGLNDHATTGSWPTRQSDARDSEPLQVPVAGARTGYLLL